MSEYSENFEKEELEEKNEILEEEHHLRLSLELNSVKDLAESYSIYVKFNYKLLGSRRTSPVQVPKSIESRIENSFQAKEFFMTKSDLYSTLASTPLVLELWHADKYSKDYQIGTVTIQMDQILRAPLKKTNNSILRVLDTWSEILNPDVIGLIRTVIYLEDLGNKRKGAVLAQNQRPEDYQAVWELELWKRAEESKWKNSLKAKEQDFIASLALEWQEKENKRDLVFQKLVNDINSLENKVKNKALDLQKREKNIIQAEKNFKTKINDSARILALKEEEIQNIRSKITEISAKSAKENKQLELQLEKFKNESAASEELLRQMKRDLDFVLVDNLKQEIEEFSTKNLNLRRNIEITTQQKDMLKVNCENFRNNFVKILKDYEEEKKIWEAKEIENLEILEYDLEKYKFSEFAYKTNN